MMPYEIINDYPEPLRRVKVRKELLENLAGRGAELRVCEDGRKEEDILVRTDDTKLNIRKPLS